MHPLNCFLSFPVRLLKSRSAANICSVAGGLVNLMLGCVMGQRLAKRDLDYGLRLYRLQRQEAAVRMWRKALRRLSGRRARFQTLGYLAAAYCDWGKYRDMLAFAVQQIELANEADSAAWRAEAYLNLARSNERLCEYHKAISYCRHSLAQSTPDPSVHAYVYLCLANAYLGFSNFGHALENFERALRASKQCDDIVLELQVYSSLGNLFTQLRDFDKGFSFYSKAAELSKSPHMGVSGPLYERQTLHQLSLAYMGMEKLKEAMEICEVRNNSFLFVKCHTSWIRSKFLSSVFCEIVLANNTNITWLITY